MMASTRVGFALTSATKVQARTFIKTKAEEKIKKEKAKKEPILNLDSQPQKHQMKRKMARPGNQTIDLPVIGLTVPGLQMLGGWAQKAHAAWMVATPLNLAHHPTHVVLDLGYTRSIGSRAAIERFKKHAWYYGITTEFCRCNNSFVFDNSETETVARSVQIWAQYFKIGFLKTRLMISDRDQEIRMLFLTRHVELTSHGCVRQEIARVKQSSHCYQNARGTRDHTCSNKKPYFSEYAMEHEIVRVGTESHFSEYAVEHEIARARAKSHFSEYAVEHEIARVRTGDRTSQSTR